VQLTTSLDEECQVRIVWREEQNPCWQLWDGTGSSAACGGRIGRGTIWVASEAVVQPLFGLNETSTLTLWAALLNMESLCWVVDLEICSLAPIPGDGPYENFGFPPRNVDITVVNLSGTRRPQARLPWSTPGAGSTS